MSLPCPAFSPSRPQRIKSNTPCVQDHRCSKMAGKMDGRWMEDGRTPDGHCFFPAPPCNLSRRTDWCRKLLTIRSSCSRQGKRDYKSPVRFSVCVYIDIVCLWDVLHWQLFSGQSGGFVFGMQISDSVINRYLIVLKDQLRMSWLKLQTILRT